MTPTTPSPNAKSGNPATQAKIDQTVKQQREAKRQEKLQEYQRQIAKRRRGKLVWWMVGGLATVIVVALVVASFVFAPKPAPTYEAGGTGAKIEGVETFENETLHVSERVDYEQTPPAGGHHFNAWLNCGVYEEPQENELAVHSQEHGAIWVTYDAAKFSDEELAALRAKLPSSYVVLSPFEGLDAPLVLSGWNSQLKLDSADDPRFEQFFEEYWRNQNVPEPTSACTGAIDGPGRT